MKGENIMSKICFGCGEKLQFVDKDKSGYIPKEKIDTSEYCQKCFRLMHYGEVVKNSEPKTIKEIVNTVNKNAKYVVFLTDFINIFDQVVKIFKSIKVPKILVISKSDIIPTNVSFNQIKNYLRVTYGIKENVVFTSNKNNLNTFVKTLYGLEEVYLLGLTNAGKSTLLNALIDKYNVNAKKITTSYKENTTSDFIRIKIGKTTFIDSPGFVIDNFELDKKTNIKGTIKPVTYQNKLVTTYNIGDLFSIKIASKTNVVFYFSNDIEIKRLYNKNIIGTSFKVKENSDIVICGLGFIKITDDTTITIPMDIIKFINIRPSIVGGKYE